MSILDEIKQVKEEYTQAILSLPNVCGIGIGYRVSTGKPTSEVSIIVLVNRKLPKAGLTAEALAPQELSGVRTDVLQVGEIWALQSRTDRMRPAQPGLSIGHYKVSAGTFGCVVHDRATRARLMLSNNHVLANINDANPGDPILQPGAADGGTVENDTIARLERFHPIDFGTEQSTCNIADGFVGAVNFITQVIGSSHGVSAYQEHPSAVNKVDAAVARPVDDTDVLDEIIDVGKISGTQQPELGMSVRKSGRTTGLTSGEIVVLNTTVNVNYGSGVMGTFEDQIVTTAMSRGGDSGSLLVNGESNSAVGLLFAGSDESTIHNPIDAVLETLDVDFSEEKEDSKQAIIEKAQHVREEHQDELMAKPNVVGVGVGLRHKGGKRTDDIALVVMVSKKFPESQLTPDALIPPQIDGIPVDIKEVGRIEAY